MREKQLAGTLLHLSHELQSCPCRGNTVTLLDLLAGGRGPIPAPSALAGVVGSLERSVEFHEQAILELERQVSEVECLVNHVKTLEQLLAQLQDIAFQTRDKSLTIAELCMNLETNVRDLQDFSTIVEEKQRGCGRLCYHAAQVPTVFVHEPMVLDSVHQQSGGIPVAIQRQVCTALVVQKTWRFHSCSSWTSLLCPFCGTTRLGTDSAEHCGNAAGAAPVILWTLL